MASFIVYTDENSSGAEFDTLEKAREYFDRNLKDHPEIVSDGDIVLDWRSLMKAVSRY